MTSRPATIFNPPSVCEPLISPFGHEPCQLTHTISVYAWNPALGLNGAGCATALWASEYYCIGTWAPTSTTIPSPTQSGIVSNCNKYAAAIKDDGCDSFAARNSISNAQLYAWNSVLGPNGENCLTSLWAGEYYCVGISAGGVSSTTTSSSTIKTTSSTTTSKATTTSKVQPAGPTQTGIAANCNKYATPASGQGCYDFAVAQGITPANLYTWNTALGANGENCGSSFWFGEYYCVGVSS